MNRAWVPGIVTGTILGKPCPSSQEHARGVGHLESRAFHAHPHMQLDDSHPSAG